MILPPAAGALVAVADALGDDDRRTLLANYPDLDGADVPDILNALADDPDMARHIARLFPATVEAMAEDLASLAIDPSHVRDLVHAAVIARAAIEQRQPWLLTVRDLAVAASVLWPEEGTPTAPIG
jgi:hypothetical protein